MYICIFYILYYEHLFYILHLLAFHVIFQLRKYSYVYVYVAIAFSSFKFTYPHAYVRITCVRVREISSS